MSGERELAWRGDDSQPEGLKTHTTYTHCTQVEDTCTHSEEIKDVAAVRSESSEMDSGMWSMETFQNPVQVYSSESGEVKSSSIPLETASVTTLSHKTSAERAEASEPITSPASAFRPQRQDDTEGLQPAAASVSKT